MTAACALLSISRLRSPSSCWQKLKRQGQSPPGFFLGCVHGVWGKAISSAQCLLGLEVVASPGAPEKCRMSGPSQTYCLSNCISPAPPTASKPTEAPKELATLTQGGNQLIQGPHELGVSATIFHLENCGFTHTSAGGRSCSPTVT